MKKIVVTAILLATTSFYAQVGIGTTNPEGALDVVSTNSGIVVPRVANTASITTPINGMIIYDLSSNCFKGYQNGAWSDCGLVPVNPILVQVGNEGDAPNTVPSVVTATQLASVPGVTGVVPANEAAYQAYIDANPALFSAPATVAEINAMITAVNVQAILVQVGNEGDAPNTVPSVVTAAQLASLPGVTYVVPANEAAYQAYIDANPALFSAPATVAEIDAMITVVNATATPITSTTGKKWMDRNLGAKQVATSATDHLAYGDLYQWGRKADGHEKINWTSSTTGTPVNGTTTINADTPANNLFITENITPHDWRVNQNANLWNGVAAVNNPCPEGFRVPTIAELNAEFSAYGIIDSATAFSSPFKFTVPGLRNYFNGSLSVGSYGYLWSSSVSGSNSSYRYFFSGGANLDINRRAYGFSVRCIKN
ncbi:hypothetical protein [Flavobacterium sp.]|uniref:hypothetical protein n=1 Tax=Flavobacterium sp. TaxID=239 RepID=UPI003F697F20